MARTAAERGLTLHFTDQQVQQVYQAHRQALQAARQQQADQARIAQDQLRNNEGVLHAHGDAPYLFERGNTASYYATLRVADGQTRTVWGKGLAQALRQAHVKTGERVRLTRSASQDHTQTAAVWQAEPLDQRGQVIERKPRERQQSRSRDDFSR